MAGTTTEYSPSESSQEEETAFRESTVSASSSSETEEGRVAGESDDTAIAEETEESDLEEIGPASDDLETNGSSQETLNQEEGEVKGTETNEEILEIENEQAEKESKNIKEIIQGFISGYWWLGVLVIDFIFLGYYYLAKGRKEKSGD